MKTLDKLVCSDQTGFIAGRCIGEDTRLIYDVLREYEIKNQKGLLIIVDFSKALGTMEWSFIWKSLQFFNYGDNIMSLVKLLQRTQLPKLNKTVISHLH